MIPRIVKRLKPAWLFAVLIGTLLVTFWPILFGGYTLYPSDILHELFLPFSASHDGTNVQVTSIIDYTSAYYPMRHFLQESLKAGTLPLWNPYVYGGHPSFASNGAVPSLDPFNVLFIFLDLPAALAWRTFAQVCFSAILMFLYLRHLGLYKAAGLLGALSYTLNSMYYANIFDWALGGFLWLPLVLLLTDKALETRLLMFVMLAGLSLGVCLLSSPLQPMAYILFIFFGLYVLRFLILEQRKGGWGYFHPLVIIISVGLLLASIQLIPSAELFLLVRRGGAVSGRTVTEAILATIALITFVFPGLGGQMKGGMLFSQAWGGETHSQGYIGFLPLLLALIATFCWIDRRKWPLIILALAGIVIVLYTPLRSFVYDRFFLVYIFSASVLAAYGANALLTDHLNRQVVYRVLKIVSSFVGLIVIATLIGSVVFWLYKNSLLDRAHTFLSSFIEGRFLGYNLPLHIQKLDNTLTNLLITSPRMFVPFVIAGCSIWLVKKRSMGRLPQKAFAVVAVALTAFDLIYMAAIHIPFVDLRKYPLFPSIGPIAMLQNDPDLFRVATLFRPGKEPPVISRSMLAPYGLPNIEGSDNVSSPWSLVNMASVQSQFEYNIYLNPRLLNVQNVKYLLTSKSVELSTEQFEVIYDEEMRVYRNRQVMPRAFVVHDYEVIADPVALKGKLNSREVDFGKTVLLEEAPKIQIDRTSEKNDSQTTIVSYQPQQVDIQVKTAIQGLLVLADTYYPGWTAVVDGISTKVLRANFGMRAIALTAGKHHVRFLFSPATFRVGLLISVCTAFAAISLIGIGFFRRG